MSDAGYDPETLLVGVMGRPHGLRGETIVRPHNPTGSDLAHVKELIVENGPTGEPERCIVERIRRTGSGWLVKLAGVGSRDAADRLTNRSVRVLRRALPPPGAREFFVEDTLGCEVFTEDGASLGRVEELFWNGAQDVWIIRAGDRETMIPLVPEYVRAVDAGSRRIEVAWTPEIEETAEERDDE